LHKWVPGVRLWRMWSRFVVKWERPGFVCEGGVGEAVAEEGAAVMRRWSSLISSRAVSV
jgi:hypothetical protein